MSPTDFVTVCSHEPTVRIFAGQVSDYTRRRRFWAACRMPTALWRRGATMQDWFAKSAKRQRMKMCISTGGPQKVFILDDIWRYRRNYTEFMSVG